MQSRRRCMFSDEPAQQALTQVPTKSRTHFDAQF